MPRRGPATPAGKAAASRNAWKHGILASAMIIPKFEDPRDWEAHRDGIFDSLEPEGHLEHMLAERIAACLWKLRRLEFHQTLVTTQSYGMGQLTDVASSPEALKRFFTKGDVPPPVEGADDAEEIPARLIPTGWFLPTITRYESHLHRLMVQTLHELEAIQTRSKGGTTPLARLDISAPPAN